MMHSLKRTPPHLSITLLIGAALAISTPPGAAAAQQVEHVRAPLFEDANRALEAAREAHADLLAPESFNEGMKRYREAEEGFEKGRSLDDIRAKLRAARQYFVKAAETTKLANVTLAAAIAAREDALAAEAPTFAERGWREAEKKFAEAARKLEDADAKGAGERSAEAEALYRAAELSAIKSHYLNETWALLQQAEKLDVRDRAPHTLARARELASLAEQQLSENRYDTDEPRSLARQARYEAQHAIYLSERIKQIDENDESWEDVILAAEAELERVAVAAGLKPRFDAGLGETSAALAATIIARDDSLARLTRELAEREERIATYEARVAELEALIGEVETEKSALTERLEAQAALRRTFLEVERLFRPAEANVVRERDDVILRLHSLNFAVGSATIEPGYFGLLTKVQRAIEAFPGCTVTIEGHTDSFGGDSANLRLSLERAQAVRQYLLANMAIEPARLEAIGLGERRPIASNETADGRKKNRRIEVIIQPLGGTGG